MDIRELADKFNLDFNIVNKYGALKKAYYVNEENEDLLNMIKSCHQGQKCANIIYYIVYEILQRISDGQTEGKNEEEDSLEHLLNWIAEVESAEEYLDETINNCGYNNFYELLQLSYNKWFADVFDAVYCQLEELCESKENGLE